MSLGSTARPLSLEQLSALVDGELDHAAVDHACAGWYDDAGQRDAWHTYHLIGDVMRSDDLACGVGRDAAFLGALRARLAAEPVVLAPSPARPQDLPGESAHRWRVRSWLGPTAVAAGFMAVAGVLVVTRGADPLAPAATAPQALAQPIPPARGLQQVADVVVAPSPSVEGGPAVEPTLQVVDGQLIRDAQLDRYLAAHKQFAGSSALGVPSAFLRSATSDASTR